MHQGDFVLVVELFDKFCIRGACRPGERLCTSLTKLFKYLTVRSAIVVLRYVIDPLLDYLDLLPAILTSLDHLLLPYLYIYGQLGAPEIRGPRTIEHGGPLLPIVTVELIVQCGDGMQGSIIFINIFLTLMAGLLRPLLCGLDLPRMRLDLCL